MDFLEGNRAQNYMANELALGYREKLSVSKKFSEDYNLRILDKPQLTYFPTGHFKSTLLIGSNLYHQTFKVCEATRRALP